MWLVRYSPTAEVQGQAIGFIPRSSLPTDEECNRLFEALDAAEQPAWSLAMRLKHRSGLRWGELIALRPVDLDFEPQRVVRVHRAVEQSRQGLTIKGTKNRQRRVSTFPASLVGPLQEWSGQVERARGREGLLFPGTDGGFAKRSRISEYRLQSRGGLGIKAMALQNEDRGVLVGAFIVTDGDEVLSITQGGQVVRSPINDDFRPTGRSTMGVKFVTPKGDDAVAVVARSVEVRPEDDEPDAAGEGGAEGSAEGPAASTDAVGESSDEAADATIETSAPDDHGESES